MKAFLCIIISTFSLQSLIVGFFAISEWKTLDYLQEILQIKFMKISKRASVIFVECLVES